jgi:hypothetical protein
VIFKTPYATRGRLSHNLENWHASHILPNQTIGLRNLGFSDDEIIEEFRDFLDERDYQGKKWKHASFDFHAHLKALSKAPNARDSNGTVLPHVARMVLLPSRTVVLLLCRVLCHAQVAQVLDVSLRREFPNVRNRYRLYRRLPQPL